jgi:two-component system, LytTR family, sensor histidine kinase AlgZ
MASIRQDVSADSLPDFRNLGVLARVLVGVNALVLGTALLVSPDLAHAAERFMQSATVAEPLLIAAVIALFALSSLLARLPYWAGCVAVVALVLVLAVIVHGCLLWLLGEAPSDLWRMLALSGVAAAGLLAYFRLLTRAYSPALAEARLQALQARIRPHFLFNSLNAVLSLIRKDPRRAERTLEDLSDLFRTLMSDARHFVRLADEIALLERYAAIEQLRLGDRLRITWELDAAPSDALLPPLVLQPLLENAVYHGVEPGTGAGDVLVRIERRGDRVLARIENPRVEEPSHRAGNRMALENIRERLALFFDAEARIETSTTAHRYCVEIEIPYKVAPRTLPAAA